MRQDRLYPLVSKSALLIFQKTEQFFMGWLALGLSGMLAQVGEHGLRLIFIDFNSDLAVPPTDGICARVFSQNQLVTPTKFSGINGLVIGWIP
jgi:hypothetical protein